MKSIEFVVIAAFGLFWLIFFLLLCCYASRKKGGDDGRRDHWHPRENEQSAGRRQYMGALGWFQRYQNRRNERREQKRELYKSWYLIHGSLPWVNLQ